MRFDQTNLPVRPLYVAAFNAGWARYLQQDMAADLRQSEYLKGPVAMARLIHEHGGDCRQIAVAACLAGPAAFTPYPEYDLDRKMLDFSREILTCNFSSPACIRATVPQMSTDARIFFQSAAIMLLEGLALDAKGDAAERKRTFDNALALYSAARGAQDTFGLDTRFEIAQRKVQMSAEQPPVKIRAGARA